VVAEALGAASPVALGRASRVIVLGEDTRERIIAKGIDPARVVVVRDGVNATPRVASQGHPVTQEIRCGFPLVVLQAGNLGFYGAWETVVKAARMLDHEAVGFVFVGEGRCDPRLKPPPAASTILSFCPSAPRIKCLMFWPRVTCT